jgi:hypothetical protein
MNFRRKSVKTWSRLAQQAQQLVAHAGDVAGAHGQHGVSWLGDGPEYVGNIVLVRDIVDVGAGGALTEGVDD